MKWLRLMIIMTIIIIIIITGIIIVRLRQKDVEIAPYIERMADGTNVETMPVESSIYFSIDACCNKIVEYSQYEDNEAVFNMLNKDYINSQGINVNNIFEVLGLKNIKKYKTLKIYRASRRGVCTIFC